MTACLQCRQRKVRCRSGLIMSDACDACSRLGFQCSFTQPAVLDGEQTNTTPTPRKRGARACDTCRLQRSKCSGESSGCERCVNLGLRCHYSLSVRRYKAADVRRNSTLSEESILPQRSQRDHGFGSPRSTGESPQKSLEVSPNEEVDEILRCDREIARQHVDAYFKYIYPIPLFSFLHHADFLRCYVQGKLSPALLLAVCGAASRFIGRASKHPERSKVWIERAEVMVFQTLGKPTIEIIQALMIVSLFHAHNHQNSKTFHYFALSVRMALYLKLHKDEHGLSFVEAECRRRLLWSMFIQDRFHAGGIPEYILLPVSILDHIRLPCVDQYFNGDIAVTTTTLHASVDPDAAFSMSAMLLRLFDIRNRILQYTKPLLDNSISPEMSLPQFQSFEQELDLFSCSLPPELQFSVREFQLRAFSPESTTFIVLQIYYHHCHCELYRLLNPGYREALPHSIVQSTSAEFVAYAQSKCLEHAVSIGEIVVTINGLAGGGPFVTDTSCFVALYQASCAILYACHRDSPAYTMSPENARRYFIAFIQILQDLLVYFPRYVVYVNDIKNMLRSIDEPNAPLPAQKATVERDFRARPIPSDEESDKNVESSKTEPHHRLESNRAARQTPSERGSSLTGIGPVPDSPALNDAELLTQGNQISAADYQGVWWSNPQEMEYDDADVLADLDQSLLWDWADALGPNLAL